MPLNPETFKKTLASWASGVTIVTSRDGDRVHGLTVSAFSSVSLDPPLVLMCLDKASNTLPLIEASKVFSVNVLAEGQEELSNRFASKKDEDKRFEGLDCSDGVNGCPHIPGAVSTLDCRVVNTIDAGDHVLYLGQVEAASTSDRRSLIYLRGQYRSLR